MMASERKSSICLTINEHSNEATVWTQKDERKVYGAGNPRHHLACRLRILFFLLCVRREKGEQ